MKTKISFLLAVAGVVAPLLAAQSEPEPGSSARYGQADTGHGGRISRKEFLASVRNKSSWWVLGSERANTGQNSATPEMFDALDRNHDGYLTRDELESGR